MFCLTIRKIMDLFLSANHLLRLSSLKDRSSRNKHNRRLRLPFISVTPPSHSSFSTAFSRALKLLTDV